MSKRIRVFFIIFVLLIISTGISWAQDETSASNVQIFVVICEDRAVMNLSGTMQAGYDVYYQIFSRSQGTGDALTTLRHVSVDGDYAFSESVTYANAAKVELGGIGSAYVSMALDSDPSVTIYEEYVDDLQDGCAEPLNPTTGSVDTGDGVDTDIAGAPVNTTEYPQILSPFGGIINPGYVPAPSNSNMPEDPNWVAPRQATPGLILAECDIYPMAEPGLLYDTDNITIFWSWYAQTEAQVQAHIDEAIYSVTYFQVVPLPSVTVSDIQFINGDYWVFYYSQLGHLRPEHYHLSFNITWQNQITDGYDNYGPGTNTELWQSDCSFDILPNEEGLQVEHHKWPFWVWW